MIISFRFKNSRSFFDETLMSMEAVSYREHPEHLVPLLNRKLLKTLVVYGSNASGKSNLLLSLASFHTSIYNQLFTMKQIQRDSTLSFLHILPQGQITPFWNSEEENFPTEMELCFINQGHLFEYGFTILNQQILTENLTMDHHLVFSRERTHIFPGRTYEKRLRIGADVSVRSNCLFCTILACMDQPDITAVMVPFEDYFFRGIQYHLDFSNPLNFMETTDLPGIPQFPDDDSDSEATAFALNHLNKLGIAPSISPDNLGSTPARYRIRSHTTGKELFYQASMNTLSNGTLKYISLFRHIYELQKIGGTLVIDNISDHFHPNVTKYIVDLVQNESNSKMQLIFTTYDTAILNNRQFRRDEVAFVDMNEYHESRLYTLADIKVRSDASFSKDYLLGKYGAIPMIRQEI